MIGDFTSEEIAQAANRGLRFGRGGSEYLVVRLPGVAPGESGRATTATTSRANDEGDGGYDHLYQHDTRAQTMCALLVDDDGDGDSVVNQKAVDDAVSAAGGAATGAASAAGGAATGAASAAGGAIGDESEPDTAIMFAGSDDDDESENDDDGMSNWATLSLTLFSVTW